MNKYKQIHFPSGTVWLKDKKDIFLNIGYFSKLKGNYEVLGTRSSRERNNFIDDLEEILNEYEEYKTNGSYIPYIWKFNTTKFKVDKNEIVFEDGLLGSIKLYNYNGSFNESKDIPKYFIDDLKEIMKFVEKNSKD